MLIPSKPATTTVPVLDVIRERWSPVIFDPRPIESEKIAQLFEAARWAPSSFNEQPWRYIYASKDDGDARILLESLLTEGNAWAKNAGLLMISFAKKTFARNGKDNRHHMHDVGCASGFMTLQAVSLGLITHQMSGFDFENANAKLGVPADFIPGSMMAVGYPGDRESAPEELREKDLKKERMRKPVEEFAFREHWNEKA